MTQRYLDPSDPATQKSVALPRVRERVIPPVHNAQTRTMSYDDEGRLTDDTGWYDLSLITDRVSLSRIVDTVPRYKTYGNVSHYSLELTRPEGGGSAHNFLYWKDPIYVKHHVYNDRGGFGHWEYGWKGNSFPVLPMTPDGWPTSFKTWSHGWDVSALIAEGCKNITPGIEQNLSLLNFLAELKDVKSLFHGPVAIAKRLVSDLGSSSKTRGLLRATGSVILHDAYVNKTMARDLLSIYTAFNEVNKQIDRLLRNQGKPMTGHWSKSFKDSDNLVEHLEEGELWYVNRNWSSNYSALFTLTMRYQYKVVDAFGQTLEADLARYGGWMDSFGLNVNPTAVWDAIPFSFVVDWFADVSGFLDGLQQKNLQSVVSLEDCCYSIKELTTDSYKSTRYQTRIHVDGPEKDSRHTKAAQYNTGLTIKNYCRQRVLPRREWLGSGLPDSLDSPNWRQWMIGGSLILAR